MPVTVTLKNVPDEIYDRLKAAAKAHHRSINGEAIACLERAVVPKRPSVEEHIEFARKLRERLPGGGFSSEEIVQSIRNDRDRR